ncbi:MAG: A/G-specific adenine glycosylase [Ruminococcaceae bacterium]|nr:A/G-specific adenine glycosylase [Oscillospiraceae bacterium]
MEQILEREAVEALVEWYRKSHRDLPWRRTKDPYRIWISEIMLQQTRVEAVKPYYARFLEAFPTVEALAEAEEQRLMKLWEGLGYYSRARNLQRAAKTIVERYGGNLPADEKLLRGLCGIGDYTAGAIASIAFGLPAPAVDGNVLRVLSRITGSYEDISLLETKKRWAEALRAVIPEDAGSFTQALIELGATVCVPNGEAKCNQCPLASRCVARRKGLVDSLPVKASKKPRRVERLTVLILQDGQRTVLHQRPPKGLLAGLFELPNLRGHLETEAVWNAVREMGAEPIRVERVEDAKHIFTHVEWHMIGYRVRIGVDFDGLRRDEATLLVDNPSLRAEYPIPSAFSAYVKYLN